MLPLNVLAMRIHTRHMATKYRSLALLCRVRNRVHLQTYLQARWVRQYGTRSWYIVPELG